MDEGIDYKKIVRKEIKNLKSKLTCDEVNLRTGKILENFYNLSSYRDCKRLYTYVKYNQEVNTRFLISNALERGISVCIPRVEGNNMEFYEIKDLEGLINGSYNIPEPNPCKSIKDDVYSGLMIMPGLAFDKFHHRIGYGGGFYDKYLEAHKDFTKVALCYDFQVLDYIETKSHDIEVDIIVSENKIL